MSKGDSTLALVEGLVRLVERVGSYADARTALSTIVRGIVDELDYDGAALWRVQGANLELVCEAGEGIDAGLAKSALGGAFVERGRCVAYGLQIRGETFGVLATCGSVHVAARLLVGMLAGRCAHILRDSRRAALQRTLLKGFSHELRAPLQSLLGHLDLVRDGTLGPVTEQQAQSLATVAAGADRVLAVCTDVLQVARIDSGHEAVIVGEVALDEILALEVEHARPLAQAAGLSLSLECPAGLRVVSDGAKLARILTNLLSNAIKYTREGGVSVRARHTDRDRVQLEVSDTGVGIPIEKRDAIFEEYVRLEPARDGTGLGLPIVRRLARMLGCSIALESEVGLGTTIRLEFE